MNIKLREGREGRLEAGHKRRGFIGAADIRIM